MSQPTAPHATPPILLRLFVLQLRALDELLQAGLADPRHPILLDWTDHLLPLRRNVADLLNHSSPNEAIPR